MNTVAKIAKNTIIQVLGKALTIAVALIGFGLVTRYLGQIGYGYFSTVYAFLTIFGILVDLGLQMTTTQLISDPQEDESKILSNALTLRLIASLIFLGLAPLVVIFFPYSPLIKIGVMVAALGFVFSSLTSTLTSLFQKHLVMGKTVVADISAKIAYLAAITLVIYFDAGLLGIIGATVLDSAMVFGVLVYFARQQIFLKPSFDWLIWKKILLKTWPIALTIALNLIYFKGDILIMSLFRSQAEVGLYGAPYKVLEVLINIAYLFLGLILPILSLTAAVKNYDKMKVIIQAAFDFLIIMTIPMVVGGFFVGRKLMVLMAGEDFAISGEIIKILFLATAAIYLAGLFGYVVVALEAQKKMIKYYALNAVISVIGYLIFIPKYSYWGAAWMTVFTEVFILATASLVMYQHLKFLPNLKIFTKSILASLVMGVVLYFFPNLSFVSSVVGGGIIYFVALFYFRGLDKKTLAIVLNKNQSAEEIIEYQANPNKNLNLK
ncbi:MAG: flippase [Candidatus Buchananbacteria bacterium]